MQLCGRSMLLAAACALALLVSPACAGGILSGDEMSLLRGGGSEAKVCGYLNKDQPCLNTAEDLDEKEVGDDCWACRGGNTKQASCKSIDPGPSQCKAHLVANWCGKKYAGVVDTDPIIHYVKFCYIGDDPGVPQGQCGGIGDPVDWCPEE